jgi:hypothetical protein
MGGGVLTFFDVSYFTLLKARRYDNVSGVIILRIKGGGDPSVEMDG